MRALPFCTITAFSALIGASCSDSTGPGDAGSVSVRMTASAATLNSLSGGALRLEAPNGRLVITDIRMIVAEFELQGSDGSCPGPGSCDFEMRPFLLDLPLARRTVRVVSDRIEPGLYNAIEFEVERLDSSEDSVALAQIRTQIPDWPRRASMLVTGTFTPTGRASVPFRTFIDAEIEIDVELERPLLVTADNRPVITIEMTPQRWFQNADGTVVDLSQFDFARTGDLAGFDFEAEMEAGLEARVQE